MSFAAIVETLADEFSVKREHAQRALDLLNDGFKVPTLARFRRAEIGGMTDGVLRRFQRRIKQLEDLEKRRVVLLASIEEQRRSLERGDAESAPEDLEPLRTCMDRFELEDLFLPHRRPEPEVQLAVDRGLEPLADLLVAPVAAPAKEGEEQEAQAPDTQPADEPAAKEADASSEAPEPAPSEAATSAEATEEIATPSAEAAPAPDEPATAPADAPADEAPADEAPADEAPADEAPTSEPAGDAPAPGAAPEAQKQDAAKGKSEAEHATAAPGEPAVHGLHIDLSPQLARACAPFVNPDRGIHTESQALDGAVRILADRLGRNPKLRSTLRRMMSKHGRLRVRGLVPEKELGRHKALLRYDKPLRQVQGHRLLSLRQAQAQRLVAPTITVEESVVLPKVRASLGSRIHPDFESVADAVAEQGLRQRLQPMIEDELRNELRDRADEEAIRFLAQHLRQVLLASPLGHVVTAGVLIDAKGDWLIHVVDRDGEPVGEEVKLEASGDDIHALAKSLGEALRSSGVRALAVGNGKAVKRGVQKLREVVHALGADASVYLVNEGGLSSYASSEAARRELADKSVPARQAIGLARRLQDPLGEFLKGDVRHLGLGREQSIVSKASLRRVLHDTVESCVAFTGCDLNRAPLNVLRHVPGLSYDLAKKLVARRAERPFSSLEELRTEGLLDDRSWTNAVGFLHLSESSEPLDRTALHPEQYDLVRRIILESGNSVEEALGRRDALRGVRRDQFGVDEGTWRDIQREVGHPGRDPRMRLFPPRLLAPDTDPATLEKGQVVEGIVSNVTSFGAFVDLGIPRDGMIHISEISSRYVRDARALLSIGHVVRARVLDASGPRVELSLKNVPDAKRRTGGDKRRGGKGPRGARGQEKQNAWPEYQPVTRAARSRRDGLVGDRPSNERRRGGGGGGGRRHGGGGGRGRRRVDESYDPAAVREASRPTQAYNPFASFFKEQKEGDEGAGEES